MISATEQVSIAAVASGVVARAIIRIPGCSSRAATAMATFARSSAVSASTPAHSRRARPASLSVSGEVTSPARGAVIGLMALSDEMIEQLYIAPAWIGHGLGQRFVTLAKERRPAGLDLYCFAINEGARGFYEHVGFEAVAFGDGSRNAERQPEVRYAWRPDR